MNKGGVAVIAIQTFQDWEWSRIAKETVILYYYS